MGMPVMQQPPPHVQHVAAAGAAAQSAGAPVKAAADADAFLREMDATAVDQQGRRNHLRYALTVPAMLGVAGVPAGVPVRCFRMSNIGVCCVSGEPMPIGRACTLTFTGRDGRLHSVPARILRCCGFGYGRSELAVRFDQPIDVSPFIPEDRGQKSEVRSQRHDADSRSDL